MLQRFCQKLNEEGKIRRILLFLVLLVCLSASLFFCVQKKGFHEDEYYSYYSTERTWGLAIENDAWTDRDRILQEYVVLPGEGFRYGFVKEVQSWDVHPPFYYWVLHTVCSLFPGTFSKWSGLGVNLFCYLVGLLLLYRMSGHVLGGERKNFLRLMVLLIWGLSPAALSSVTFIRMYAMLTCFILLMADLHVVAVQKEKILSVGFLVPVWLCFYFGFLTQYYFFIFFFFLGGTFSLIRLLKTKKIGELLGYAGTVLSSFVVAYLTYPCCLGQMFHGQRGAQATNSFFDLGNTWERILYFESLVDRFVLGGILGLLLLLAIWLWIFGRATQIGSGKEEKISGTGETEGKKGFLFRWITSLTENPVVPMLWLAVIFYFLTVSKTGLMLGDSSIRYELPIGAILLLLIVAGMDKLLIPLLEQRDISHRILRKIPVILTVMLLVAMPFVQLAESAMGGVLFLYPEDEKKIELASENAHTPVIYFYDAAQNWCIWDSTDELLQYEKIYFRDASQQDLLTDSEIAAADHLIVYLRTGDDTERLLQLVKDSCKMIGKEELLFQDTYCYAYELGKTD